MYSKPTKLNFIQSNTTTGEKRAYDMTSTGSSCAMHGYIYVLHIVSLVMDYRWSRNLIKGITWGYNTYFSREKEIAGQVPEEIYDSELNLKSSLSSNILMQITMLLCDNYTDIRLHLKSIQIMEECTHRCTHTYMHPISWTKAIIRNQAACGCLKPFSLLSIRASQNHVKCVHI